MKKIISFLLVLTFVLMGATVSYAENFPRLVDGAELLSKYEATEIESRLNEISERQKLDVVIVTTDELYGKSPRDFADDYFDSGYGFGNNKDGVLLLINMEERDWYLSTRGFAVTAFTDAGIDYMAEEFVPYMSDGDFYRGFEVFTRLCDEFITQAKNGEPYDRGNLPKEPLGFIWIVVAVGVGLVVALIVTASMKRRLKNVRSKTEASDYIRKGSFNITNSRDLFLYRNVSRVKIQTNSGGSSTHRSSSGARHGGRGGKF